MDFRGLVRKWVWKITFFGLKSCQDLRNRAAHPYQEFPRVTPPPPPWGNSQNNGPSLLLDDVINADNNRYNKYTWLKSDFNPYTIKCQAVQKNRKRISYRPRSIKMISQRISKTIFTNDMTIPWKSETIISQDVGLPSFPCMKEAKY